MAIESGLESADRVVISSKKPVKVGDIVESDAASVIDSLVADSSEAIAASDSTMSPTFTGFFEEITTRAYVLVNDFGTIIRRDVQVGQENGDKMAIESGLEQSPLNRLNQWLLAYDSHF
jgi:hypothetical protein